MLDKGWRKKIFKKMKKLENRVNKMGALNMK